MGNLLERLDVRDLSADRVSRESPSKGHVTVVSRSELGAVPEWQRSFFHLRKDCRYYELVEDTICPELEYCYLALKESGGRTRSIQPFFLVNQDLLAGAGPEIRKIADRVRRRWPRFMTLRTLMVGCVAGEGQLSSAQRGARFHDAQLLSEHLVALARKEKAALVVLKEFPAHYREALACLTSRGFTRVPSMPMTRLDISNYASFEDYMNKAIKSRRRSEFRKKFKAAEQLGVIDLEVCSEISSCIDEIYPLYLQVYERAALKFEKLTRAYFMEIGQRMPDKARFFVWRLRGKIVAFSLCLIEEDRLYGEYIGFDYSVAHKLNLYFHVMRDTICWAIENGFKAILSSGLSYAPKLQMRHVLEPLDLYVRHTSPIVNIVLKRFLPLLEPTRSEPILKQFPNYSDLWGRPS